jgi:imidazole glycerol-phosphate synthase subunit HisF
MKPRVLARLDIKGPNLIKGVHLEGLRKLGDPNEFALRYYNQGADGLIMMDIVASLYGRNNLLHIVEKACENVFIPITVGGGIRSIDDVQAALSSGADKVAINTAAINDPGLVNDVAKNFGSQCMVLSIEAKKTSSGWECYTDNGRERTHKSVIEWATEAVSLGAGEILLTSVDQEGTRKGFDNDLTSLVSSAVDVPVIASGGFGVIDHLGDVLVRGKADAIAIADALHFNRVFVNDIKNSLDLTGVYS